MGCGRVRLKSIHHAGGGVQIISFAFVLDRCEVIQDADACGGESHIVPELLTLLRADMLNRLALHEDIIADQEVHEMLMLDALAMELDGEIILALEGDVRLVERDSQCLLIHVLVEERPHVAMDNLAAADDVIGVGTEPLGEMGVGRLEFMYGIVGHILGVLVILQSLYFELSGCRYLVRVFL